MKKRILHAVDSSGFYGTESVILNIAEGMKNTRYENIVGSFSDKINYQSDLSKAAEKKGLLYKNIYLKGKFNPVNILTLAKILRSEKIDLIHSHGYKTNILGFFAGKISNTPLIVTNHLFKKSGRKLQLYHQADLFILKYIPKIIAVSDEIRDIFIEKGINKNKIIVIDNGINVKEIESKSKDKSIFKNINNLKGSILIGCLGRLNVQKGFTYLLDAAKIVLNNYANIKFIIAGEGPQKNELIHKLKDLKLEKQFHFIGYCNDPINFLKNIDIFILPSIDEGLPIALLEAMACKLPIITTNVGSITKVIQNKQNGLIGPASSVPFLVESIIYLIENKQEAREFGENAFQTVVTKFSNDHMAEQYARIYSELLD